MSKISRKHKCACLHTCVRVWFSWRPFSLNYMLCVHLGVHCCQAETLHQSDMKVFVSAQLATPAVCRVNRDPLTPRTCLEMSFKQGLQPLCAGRCFVFRSSLQENRKTLQLKSAIFAEPKGRNCSFGFVFLRHPGWVHVSAGRCAFISTAQCS